MFNYKSQKCDVCGKEFKEDDDIVVCPVCGTPHHRSCWLENGHCVNEDKHAEGFEWKPVQTARPVITVGAQLDKCPHCGHPVRSDSKFCENCGRPLNVPFKQVPAPERRENEYDNQTDGPFNTTFEDFNARIEREMSGEIDGVKVRDMYTYIGPNAQYFVYKFRRMSEDSRYRPFDFVAFLFRPLWYIYRKMWVFGVMAAMINLLLSIPTSIMFLVEAGMLSASSPLVFSGIETVAMVFSFVEMAVNIFWGLMAVPAYKKQVVSELKKLGDKYSYDQQTYYEELRKKSGPSKVGMALIFVFSIIYILSLFLPY